MPKRAHTSTDEISKDDQRRERELGVKGASSESVTPRPRRTFTASEKQRILKAAETARASGERGAVRALLREEGIYNSHLASWGMQFAQRGALGLEARKPGRKPTFDERDRHLLALTKRNAVLERKLYIANALIGLQKKAHEILGIALPENDEES